MQNENLVLLFSARDNAYSIIDHNLTEDEAKTSVSGLRKQGLPAFRMEQRSPHFLTDAGGCCACAKDIGASCLGETARRR